MDLWFVSEPCHHHTGGDLQILHKGGDDLGCYPVAVRGWFQIETVAATILQLGALGCESVVQQGSLRSEGVLLLREVRIHLLRSQGGVVEQEVGHQICGSVVLRR